MPRLIKQINKLANKRTSEKKAYLFNVTNLLPSAILIVASPYTDFPQVSTFYATTKHMNTNVKVNVYLIDSIWCNILYSKKLHIMNWNVCEKYCFLKRHFIKLNEK